jgi:CSLREA domain-containing protein
MKRFLPLAILALLALGLAATPASAATVVVNTTTDQSLGSCSSSCSLRDAVATANSGDTVQIPAGTYVLTLGDIITETSLTIVGAGARSTVLDGNGASRIFQFDGGSSGQTVELDDLSLIHGLAATPELVLGTLSGGALAGDTSLTLRRCRLAGNQAETGGAIFWTADTFAPLLNLDQCTIEGNLATSAISLFGFDLGGGGIFALQSIVTISNSTLTGNTASVGQGGGVASLGFAGGVGLFNATVTANHAPSEGGLLVAGAAVIANSIIADNPGGDCGIGLFASDHNLDSDSSCGFTDAGSHPGVPPLLGPLANNGGPTDTQALLAGSPALNSGNNATCLATDQRGVTRPQGPACDIGAFEAPATPQDQIASLIAQINALVTGGTLAQNKANPLITKLNQVLSKLNGGQTTAACGQLGAFINQLNADIGNGTLTPAQGQPLLAAVNALKASMGC